MKGHISLDHRLDHRLDHGDGQAQELAQVDTTSALSEPPKLNVILYNDDYTSMDFVVEVLIHIFRKTEQEATRIMLRIHAEGKGLAGVYCLEIAETKVSQVHRMARSRGFPLKCGVEFT